MSQTHPWPHSLTTSRLALLAISYICLWIHLDVLLLVLPPKIDKKAISDGSRSEMPSIDGGFEVILESGYS